METVLELMGVQEAGMGERSTLADMGMDSLQMVEIRTKITAAIGRPMPLEQARLLPCLPSTGGMTCTQGSMATGSAGLV